MMSTVARYVVITLMLTMIPPVFAQERLTLEAAIQYAMANNPIRGVAQCQITAATANLQGAHMLRNPEILIAPTVIGTQGAESVVAFAQPLELNGARGARTRIATGALRTAEAGAQITNRDLTLNVSIAYWDLAQAEAIAGVDAENVRYAETLLAAARKQVELGHVPESQAIKTEVELARAQQQLTRTKASVAQAQITLNTVTGRDPNIAITTADALTSTSTGFDLVAAQNQDGTLRPELAQAQAQMMAAAGEVEAARAARRPDLLILAQTQNWNGPGGVAIGLSLPVFDWGSARAEIRRAGAALAAQEKNVDVVRQNVRRDVRTAAIAVSSAESQVRVLRERVLGPAETLANMANLGYQEGATNYLEVLEARRTLRAAHAEYHSALGDYHRALAQLAWASGSTSLLKSGEEKR